ncbi:hypothetical protein AC231_15030 [Clostridium pasteurianum]|nr:hypothetical protein AQ983_02500 [Clostridium pasteurianum DSM 525 = ATCC 6013]AOZ77832.1 hypothetical protein AQ984_02500 [Clostridium pasteurianum]OMH21724.1 hypothetical protein AC231_15030 [Clostridium pasteurianum]
MHGLLGVELPLEEKQRAQILIWCESLSQSASREPKSSFRFCVRAVQRAGETYAKLVRLNMNFII